MSIDYYSGTISRWYGAYRLRQAVASGIIKKTMEAPEAAMNELFAPITGKVAPPSAAYEHPSLGKNLDMVI